MKFSFILLLLLALSILIPIKVFADTGVQYSCDQEFGNADSSNKVIKSTTDPTSNKTITSHYYCARNEMCISDNRAQQVGTTINGKATNLNNMCYLVCICAVYGNSQEDPSTIIKTDGLDVNGYDGNGNKTSTANWGYYCGTSDQNPSSYIINYGAPNSVDTGIKPIVPPSFPGGAQGVCTTTDQNGNKLPGGVIAFKPIENNGAAGDCHCIPPDPNHKSEDDNKKFWCFKQDDAHTRTCGASEVCDDTNQTWGWPCHDPSQPLRVKPTGTIDDGWPELNTQQGGVGTQNPVIPLVTPPCKAFDPNNGNCSVFSTAIGDIQTNNPAVFIESIFSLILGFSGGIAVLLIIFSGYQMMISQGNAEKVKEAQERLTAAIAGLIFIIFSVVLLQVIGVDILHIPGLGK